jgi:hypothetical protein
MAAEQCEATHRSPTATGEVEVRCVKPQGHEGQHEGRVKVFPVRWD